MNARSHREMNLDEKVNEKVNTVDCFRNYFRNHCALGERVYRRKNSLLSGWTYIWGQAKSKSDHLTVPRK